MYIPDFNSCIELLILSDVPFTVCSFIVNSLQYEPIGFMVSSFMDYCLVPIGTTIGVNSLLLAL